MIVELLTMFMIIAIGGICYVGLYELHTSMLTAYTTALPAYFVNDYTALLTSIIYWLPAFIVSVAIATFVVMNLRRKADETFGY